MDAFVMEIAGFAIGVEPLFETTRHYCRDYLTDREPEFHVTVTREDLKLIPGGGKLAKLLHMK